MTVGLLIKRHQGKMGYVLQNLNKGGLYITLSVNRDTLNSPPPSDFCSKYFVILQKHFKNFAANFAKI